MTKYFKAESNGFISLRSSANANYTAAVIFLGTDNRWHFTEATWSSRMDLAAKVAGKMASRGSAAGVDFDLVSAVEITKAEFNALTKQSLAERDTFRAMRKSDYINANSILVRLMDLPADTVICTYTWADGSVRYTMKAGHLQGRINEGFHLDDESFQEVAAYFNK